MYIFFFEQKLDLHKKIIFYLRRPIIDTIGINILPNRLY